MHILIVTPYYLPDGGPSAALFAMLGEALVKREHSVTVLCAAPHYPTGRVLAEYRKKQGAAIENGVRVVRVGVPSLDRANLALRMLQFLAYQAGASARGLRLEYEVVLLSNPMLTVGLPFLFLSVLRNKPAVYSIHDVYPDVGVTLGVFRHQAVIQVVSALERYALKRARTVRILSESFRAGMHALGVPDEKLALVYDWVDTELIRPMAGQNGFASENGLADKFVVMYAGNIGLSQGLEHVVTAAEMLYSQEDIRFVFVGEGMAKAGLVERVKQRSLDNVRFIPVQPRACLPEVLAAANVSLVTLQKGIGAGSLPSKSFSILASGRPLIASVDENSDVAKLVERSQAGVWVPPENPEKLAEAILDLKENTVRCRQFGENGRNYVLEHHTADAAARRFEEIFRSALQPIYG
jgi:colanic acid biosynthesis glycosyl transferase WcaI